MQFERLRLRWQEMMRGQAPRGHEETELENLLASVAEYEGYQVFRQVRHDGATFDLRLARDGREHLVQCRWRSAAWQASRSELTLLALRSCPGVRNIKVLSRFDLDDVFCGRVRLSDLLSR